MKKVLLCMALVSVFAFAATTMAASGNSAQILHFTTMYGVEGPFQGTINAMRGVDGDTLPWEIKKATGTLFADGKLRLNIKGLVFANDPNVPANLVGTNDEANFRVAVSCLTFDTLGVVSTANVISAPFPATSKGNANINTTLTLPQPCLAPVVLIMAGADADWFAVSGGEEESSTP